MLNGSGLVLTFRLIKENKMFTIDIVVDTVVKGTKQVTALITDADFRKEVDTVVEANAKFAKASYNTGLDLAKTFVESFSKNVYAK
jgi:hypothetical protein